MEIKKNTEGESPKSMELPESVNNHSISMRFSVASSCFTVWRYLTFWLFVDFATTFYKVCNTTAKRRRNSVFKVCIFFRILFVGLGGCFFPRHPAPLAPAGVCITEKHNSVQPLAERFCFVLVTTKIYSGGVIHKKRIFVGRVWHKWSSGGDAWLLGKASGRGSAGLKKPDPS